MKEILIDDAREEKGNQYRTVFSIKNYLIVPLKAGVFGFAIFITILLMVKLFSYIIGTYDYFAIELSDIELSVIGFVLLFLIRFLENFKEEEE